MSRTAAREAAAVLLGGAAAGGAVWLLFLLASYRARPDLCLAAGVAAAAVWRLVRATAAPPEPPLSTPDPPGEVADGFAELTSLEHRLSWAAVDPDRYRKRVRPLLVDLAVERLRTRHGVDPATRPELARRILGEPLWQLVTAPPVGRGPTRAELTRLVDDLERL